jgi:hypothetical protein
MPYKKEDKSRRVKKKPNIPRARSLGAPPRAKTTRKPAASTPVRVKTKTKSLSGSKKRKPVYGIPGTVAGRDAIRARHKLRAAATKPTRIDLSEVQKRRVKRRATFDKLQENKKRRDKQMAAFDKSTQRIEDRRDERAKRAAGYYAPGWGAIDPTAWRPRQLKVPASKPRMAARQAEHEKKRKPVPKTPAVSMKPRSGPATTTPTTVRVKKPVRSRTTTTTPTTVRVKKPVRSRTTTTVTPTTVGRAPGQKLGQKPKRKPTTKSPAVPGWKVGNQTRKPVSSSKQKPKHKPTTKPKDKDRKKPRSRRRRGR